MVLEMEARPSASKTWAETPAAYLVWEDLTAALPSYGGGRPVKKLIQGLSGYAVPGRILAIMGPSGSGKSTLLDSLAGSNWDPCVLFALSYDFVACGFRGGGWLIGNREAWK